MLNRIVRQQRSEWQLEADPRHCELIVEHLQLQKTGGLSTPGADADDNGGDEEAVVLTGQDVTLFRGLAARCNYRALDRPDIQYSAKEICRETSAPTTTSLNKLVRLARYLVVQPRAVWQFECKKAPGVLTISVDSNWASCKRTRKSTSGGAAVWGNHLI